MFSKLINDIVYKLKKIIMKDSFYLKMFLRNTYLLQINLTI